MALTLSLTKSQSNDATTLTITDGAGTYATPDNEGGWGGGVNESVTDIVTGSNAATPSKYHLLLDVVVTDKDGTETTYDTINLFDHDSTGPFTDATELTWDINPADLVESGTAMGLATDELDDGVYEVTYQLVSNSNHSSVAATWSDGWIIDGKLRNAVYDKLRQVPVDYDNENNDMSRDIMEALLQYSYLEAINAYDVPESYTDQISDMVYILDKMVSDSSKYTW